MSILATVSNIMSNDKVQMHIEPEDTFLDVYEDLCFYYECNEICFDLYVGQKKLDKTDLLLFSDYYSGNIEMRAVPEMKTQTYSVEPYNYEDELHHTVQLYSGGSIYNFMEMLNETRNILEEEMERREQLNIIDKQLENMGKIDFQERIKENTKTQSKMSSILGKIKRKVSLEKK